MRIGRDPFFLIGLKMSDKTQVTWHEHSVQRQRGRVVWFTGLSGSGKSTVANLVDQLLHEKGIASFVLDGDNVRMGLNASREQLGEQFGEVFAERFGLGFGEMDRQENIRRIGAVAELFCEAGLIALTAFVSPFRRDRDQVRRYIESHGSPGDFVEVFVDTPIAICEQRDPKGLYQKARAGEIKNFTGISDPYEAPGAAELILNGGNEPPEQLAQSVLAFLFPN